MWLRHHVAPALGPHPPTRPLTDWSTPACLQLHRLLICSPRVGQGRWPRRGDRPERSAGWERCGMGEVMQPRPISRPTRGSGSIGAETNRKPSSLLDSRPSPMAPILVEPLGRWGHRSSALLFGQIPIERRLRDPQRPADVLDGVRRVAVEHHGVPLLLVVKVAGPPILPRARAAARPARVRSRMMSRSTSARAPKTWKTSLPRTGP